MTRRRVVRRDLALPTIPIQVRMHQCVHVVNETLTERITDSASSAVRNLNDYEIMGRKLRVDFSTDKNADDNQQDQVRSIYRGSSRLRFPYADMKEDDDIRIE